MDDTETPSAAPKYRVDTILNMARIPEEAMPRFLAELPSILKYLRATAKLQDTLDPRIAKLISKEAIWVDDGKNDKRTTVEISSSCPND